MTRAVDVQCSGDTRRGWTCFAQIREADRPISEHEVRVSPADVERLAPGAADPTDLVQRSIEFLLRREAPSSILRSFDLIVIDRFYPEYSRTIRQASRAI